MLDSICKYWYNKRYRGADIAFDERTLTGYFASRNLHVTHLIIANTFASKIQNAWNNAVDTVASAIRVPVLATATA